MKNQEDSIVIPQGGTYYFAQLDEIVRIEAEGSYVTFFMKDGRKLLSSKNLGHFKGLESAGFFTAHRSHMINVAHLTSYSKEGILRMEDGSQVPVSRRRKGAFFDKVVSRFQPVDNPLQVVKKMDLNIQTLGDLG